MRSASRSIIAMAVALGAFLAPPDADARKIGKSRIKAGKVAHNIKPYKRARKAVRNVRRAGRWVNGVWVVGGVASSVAVGTASNCGYYWRKWKETGSSYWRERYYENC